MKRCFGCLVAFGLIASAAAVVAQRPAARGGDQREAGQNGWLFSLDEGRAEARKSGMPLMVVIRCQP